ncbi:aldo/keto reductase [Ponticaulis sp.]|uniref:aldo/keto reductase n=1 Tax=Ponticaulis sp. TaxID=2020902 RepID=UPI000B765F15|nr:aldo/keto reductase [Ponticaulis sp.]MAI91250.1 aldo/keto reductase [Ponticaulis sp.]OUX98561.1 MAG: aldo/keto reductase [Hyphomonadaceae bacterium TMED5]|tara:strand:- start:29176 stop:30180 length:1005 start_codon:yes stop_codon:yes gene_type:complete
MSFGKRELAGREVTPIGLGCMSLSQGYLPLPSEEEGERLLHHAIDIGYDLFDTARLYGRGHNEELLSRVLKSRRDEIFLSSKCGIEFGDGKRWIDCKPETIRTAVDKSLKVMGVDFIDLYYLHRRDFTVPIEESVGTLAELMKAGKIGGIGLSEMSSDTLRKAAAETTISAMQTEYSLWTRNPELGVLETCKEVGAAFVAFSPVGRGALADSRLQPRNFEAKDLRSPYPRFDGENWPKNQDLILKLEALAKTVGASAAQLSLYWVLSQGDHILTIPGTGKIPHLEENFETLKLDIPASVLAEADKLINQSTVSGHRYPDDDMRATIDTEEFPAA